MNYYAFKLIHDLHHGLGHPHLQLVKNQLNHRHQNSNPCNDKSVLKVESMI